MKGRRLRRENTQTHRVHVEHRPDLLEPHKLISRATEARLARQVVCDRSHIPIVSDRPELSERKEP